MAPQIKTPKINNKLEGKSLVKLILKNKPLNREYVVSESWFQSTVITKSKKLEVYFEDFNRFIIHFFLITSD